LDSFDKLYLIGGGKDNKELINYALALAKIEDPSFKYSAKVPQFEFGKKIEMVETIENRPMTDNTVVVCLEESLNSCKGVSKGIAVFIADKPIDPSPETAKILFVDARMVKSTSAKNDQLEQGVTYREVVYDVIIQIALNHASKSIKKPQAGKAALPPPGGLAHNPIYGSAFLAIAFFALFMSDGYLGLVALFSRLLKYESNNGVTWEKAMEKIHAQVPGLHHVEPNSTGSPLGGDQPLAAVQMSGTVGGNTISMENDPELAQDTDKLLSKT
jgi:hypothetical protein